MDDRTTRTAEDARGISVNLLTLLAQAAFPAFHVQLARRLGAGGYGIFLWCDYLLDLFSLLTLFGMDQAIQRRVALLHGDDDDAAVRAVGTALRSVILSGLAVTLGLWVAAPFIAAARHQPLLADALRCLALKPAFYHATTIFLVATQARGRMQYDFWVRGVAQPLSLLVGTTAVLSLGGGVAPVALVVTLAIAGTTGLAGWLYGRALPLGPTLRAAWSGPVDRETLRTALPLVIASMVWAAQSRIEPLFLGRWRGDAAVAAFGASLLYVNSISQVRGIFAPVVMRRIPPALRDGRLDELRATLALQVRWSAALAAPLAVLFGGFAAPLLSVFGREFALGSGAMAVLAAGHLVNACALANYVIPMSGRTRYSTITAGLAALFQLLVLPPMARRWGLTGAAVSAAGGLVFAQLVQGVFAWRIARVHGLSWGLGRVLLAAAAALVAGRAVFAAVSGPVVFELAAGVGAAAAVYLALLAAFGLEPEERDALRALRARWR